MFRPERTGGESMRLPLGVPIPRRREAHPGRRDRARSDWQKPGIARFPAGPRRGWGAPRRLVSYARAKYDEMSRDRRSVLKVVSTVLGGGAALAVGGPALRAVLDPAGKQTVTGVGEFVAVARLEALPADGTPVAVPVVVDEPRDGWTVLPPTTVGAVFLRRDGAGVRALSTVCPHLGCGVDYDAQEGMFACPCHKSFFHLDGRVSSGPSPRSMDELETRVLGEQVEVRFQKFKIGTSTREPA